MTNKRREGKGKERPETTREKKRMTGRTKGWKKKKEANTKEWKVLTKVHKVGQVLVCVCVCFK